MVIGDGGPGKLTVLWIHLGNALICGFSYFITGIDSCGQHHSQDTGKFHHKDTRDFTSSATSFPSPTLIPEKSPVCSPAP